MRTRFGHTLVIANPAAHSGAAQEVAARLTRFLELYLADDGPFDLVCTERAGHAVKLAASAGGYATVLALGGDGVIHEVANGLMTLPSATRPVLGVVPVGSGNDYARTLGMREVSSDADLAQLLSCAPAALDVGKVAVYGDVDGSGPWAAGSDVNSAPAGGPAVSYFVQTFSFGLDAAIALGTMDLRRSTPLTGTSLYLASGLKVFGRDYRDFPVEVSFDGGAPERLRAIIFAVQIGPTYGSGFQIAPDADPADGCFDVCYAAGPVPRAVALPLFLSAKSGRHVKSRRITSLRAQRLDIQLGEANMPIQADGERLRARALSLELVPGALSVLRPQRAVAADRAR